MSTSPPERTRSAVARAPQSERGLVAFLAALSGLSALGIDLILPALSDVRAAFGLAPDSTQVSLVVTIYIFGLGSGQVLWGPLADRFGRKRVVLAGLALYAAGAVGSAFAPALGVMLAFRLLMGLGAASPRAMSLTIARDSFEGDAMTRVVSLVMVFFQLSPAVAPLLGEGLLVIGPWQGIFLFAAVAATAVAVSTSWFRETLLPSDRRPLTFGRTAEAARAVFTSRWALGHGLVLMFEFSAFYVYLSSSELVFDDVFGRGSQFALFFAASAVLQAGGNVVASRVVPRIGSQRFMTDVMVAYVAISLVLVVVTVAGGGHPPFWPWLLLLWGVNVLHALVLTTANSLAMQPLARLAGTGAGVIGTLSMMGGAILASLVASTIDDSATPMAMAYFGFGSLALLCLLWARRGRSDALLASRPVPPAPDTAAPGTFPPDISDRRPSERSTAVAKPTPERPSDSRLPRSR
jgi:DHA1 family bicyclomycin/chloramphenicol resistance-like MFS transporter